MEDLYQCGIEGLLKAIGRYNPELGKFTTHSIRYIKHEISSQINFLNQDTLYYGEKRKRIKNAAKSLEMEGKESSDAAIAEKTGLTVKSVKKEREREKRMNLVYLDGTEDGCENLLPTVSSAEDYALREAEKNDICRVKEELSEELRKVWDMRYVESMSRSKTAETLNISEHYVKKHEDSIKEKMEALRKNWNS